MTPIKGLLATGKSGKYNFWSVEFYQQFFDVDTSDVKDRIVAGMIPRPGKSFSNCGRHFCNSLHRFGWGLCGCSFLASKASYCYEGMIIDKKKF